MRGSQTGTIVMQLEMENHSWVSIFLVLKKITDVCLLHFLESIQLQTIPYHTQERGRDKHLTFCVQFSEVQFSSLILKKYNEIQVHRSVVDPSNVRLTDACPTCLHSEKITKCFATLTHELTVMLIMNTPYYQLEVERWFCACIWTTVQTWCHKVGWNRTRQCHCSVDEVRGHTARCVLLCPEPRTHRKIKSSEIKWMTAFKRMKNWKSPPQQICPRRNK